MMNTFKSFFRIREAAELDWGHFGDIAPTLGTGKSDQLNYGTAKDFGGDPMLYVPVKRGKSDISSVVTAARRQCSKNGIDCVPDPSAFGGWRCGPSKKPHQADIMHTGEQHVTVALGAALKPVFDSYNANNTQQRISLLRSLKTKKGQPLFDASSNGMALPVTLGQSRKLVCGLAKSFKGTPIVVLMPVQCPGVYDVREALNLPPLPNGYTFHITVGYSFGKQDPALITTDPDFQGQATGSARQKHNQTFLDKQQPMGLPEWFEYVGELYF